MGRGYRPPRPHPRAERDHKEHRHRWRALAVSAADLALSMDWTADDRFTALATEAATARQAWTWASDQPEGALCEVLAVIVHRWGRQPDPRVRAALAPAVAGCARLVVELLARQVAPEAAAGEPGSPGAAPRTLPYRADVDG